MIVETKLDNEPNERVQQEDVLRGCSLVFKVDVDVLVFGVVFRFGIFAIWCYIFTHSWIKNSSIKTVLKPAKIEKTREFRIAKIKVDTCRNVLIRIFRKLKRDAPKPVIYSKNKTKSKVN